jgi:DNA-binding Xre family transcriptional regulator
MIMPIKNFQHYVEKRLTTAEIKDIERHATLERHALKTLQQDIVNVLADYVAKEGVGFSELVRRLNASPAHVVKIQKGEANITLASLARICALLGVSPHLVFSEKSN